MIEHGPVEAVRIEAISSYGVGITAAVRQAGIRVVDVNRPRPAERRKQGLTDRLGAYRAARSVLSGEATADPKNASIEPVHATLIPPPTRIASRDDTEEATPTSRSGAVTAR